MSTIDATAVTEWARGKRHTGQMEKSACRWLRELAGYVPADEAIVELGVYQGRATGWLLLGADEGHGAHVTAVDPWGMRRDDYSPFSPRYTHPRAYQAFKDHMDRVGADKATLTVKRGYARTMADKWKGPAVGLLVHDAEHTPEAVQAELEAWLPHLSSTAHVVVHGAADARVRDAVAAVLGVNYDQGWGYGGADRWTYAEPRLIPWAKHPDRRGLIIAQRTQPRTRAALPVGAQHAVNATGEPEAVVAPEEPAPAADVEEETASQAGGGETDQCGEDDHPPGNPS